MEGQWRAFIPPEGLCIPAGHESAQSAELQLRQWVFMILRRAAAANRTGFDRQSRIL